MKVALQKFEQALTSLGKALEPPPRNDRERDGAIQRFEYTFEATWKTAQRNLKMSGIDAASPRDVIREMGRLGWITSVEDWFDFLEKRNLTSHTYQEETAEKVWKAIPDFYKEALALLERFRKL
jgi:nucleotidyltransferase substrate binding protein (TIGR01987 family)